MLTQCLPGCLDWDVTPMLLSVACIPEGNQPVSLAVGFTDRSSLPPIFAVPPRITLPPSLPGPVLLGTPFRLTCNATGTPNPTLMWLKDGNPVSPKGTPGLKVSSTGWHVSNLLLCSLGTGSRGQAPGA